MTRFGKRSRASAALAAFALVVLAAAGCASTAQDAPAAEANGQASNDDLVSSDALQGQLTVFAAASLTATFTELAEQFEIEHPGVTITLNFGGSSGLVTQLDEGAVADVFASADENNMHKAQELGLVTAAPVLFATNTLEIAVPTDNPAGVSSLADLGAPGVRLVVCAPQVPCGAATEKVALASGVTLAPVSEEPAVTDVLGKVVSGEADAGIVYRTDVLGAGDTVLGVAFPEADEVVNRYPIAPLTGASNPEVAQAFVDFVAGPVGAAVLEAAGFGVGG